MQPVLAIRSLCLRVCLPVLLLFALFCARALADGTARPNILLIIADDLRNDIGCYGDALAITPHLDRLADTGVVFDRAYCQQAVCNPSRASMLTGVRPDSLGVMDLHTHFRVSRPDVVTLPQLFKDNGYYTRGIGKVFHNDSRLVDDRPPMADPLSWTAPPILATGAHWQDWVEPGNPFGPARKAESWQSLDVPDEAYFDGQIAALAVAAIKDLRTAEQPFFLAVGFWKPHLPFNAPKRYWDLYDREDFPLPPVGEPSGIPRVARHVSHELRTYTDVTPDGAIDAEQAALLQHGYYACISFLDTQVGKVIDQLRNSGLADSTVVVFVSDHGFHLGERGLWGKTSVYELDARVPLIVRAPDVTQPGTRSGAVVELIDLFPTIAELAALALPPQLQGSSLIPLLQNPTHATGRSAITFGPQPFYSRAWEAMGIAVRDERFRYIEWRCQHTNAILERELYDHGSDRHEICNRIADSAYGMDADRLAAIVLGLNPAHAIHIPDEVK